MSAPTRRLRAVPTARCAGYRKPMTVYEAGQTTHPACDPVYGWPPHGGRRRDVEQRQLRLIEGGAR